MKDNNLDLRTRTKEFALRIIRLYKALPKTNEARILGYQVLRSGTSIGANFREGIRARSSAEFVSKLETALQELEETVYWLELLQEIGAVEASRLEKLMKEADELIAILVSSVKTVKTRHLKHKSLSSLSSFMFHLSSFNKKAPELTRAQSSKHLHEPQAK